MLSGTNKNSATLNTEIIIHSWFLVFLTEQKCINIPAVLVQHTFNGPFSRTTQVSQYQNGKINLDFTEARDSEWLCLYIINNNVTIIIKNVRRYRLQRQSVEGN